ncbi:MAG: SDR family oxidoreductase [Halioglobus sp.]|nr:SDR family oxidoreductase [Halioglobus sp.]
MKIAIITGASVGIGSATAQVFLDEGFTVFCLARRECPVAGVHSIACDITSEASIGRSCDTLESALQNCAQVALVHNAAQMRKDSVDDCSSESLVEVMQTNVIGINSLNQRLIPLMPNASSVIYVGSTLSEKAVPGTFSYVVSKHAQLGMMRATCQDLMGRKIHTALICPGFTDTEMLRKHIGTDPKVEADIAGVNSFGRLIKPGEIAEMIRWAHHNPIINGAVLHGNLGQKTH